MVKVRGDKEVYAFIRSIGQGINIEIPIATKKQAEWGKQIAAAIAPVDTGALVNAIDTRKNKDISYSVVSRTPKGRSNPRRVPYHVFLSKGVRGGYEGTIKSGDHQYMDTTARELRQSYPEEVEKVIDRLLKNK